VAGRAPEAVAATISSGRGPAALAPTCSWRLLGWLRLSPSLLYRADAALLWAPLPWSMRRMPNGALATPSTLAASSWLPTSATPGATRQERVAAAGVQMQRVASSSAR
jgi:hypothetical protein